GDRSFVAFNWHYKDGTGCLYYNGTTLRPLPKPFNNSVWESLLIDNQIIACDRHHFDLVFYALSFTRHTNGELVFDDQWKYVTEVVICEENGRQWKDLHRLGQDRLFLYNPPMFCDYHILDIRSGQAVWTRGQLPDSIPN